MTDHKKEAEEFLELGFRTQLAEHEQRSVAMAHVHATLYLAEQQRIANIIAAATWNNHVLLSGGRRPGNEEMDEAAEWEQVGRMFVEIREGLGLA